MEAPGECVGSRELRGEVLPVRLSLLLDEPLPPRIRSLLPFPPATATPMKQPHGPFLWLERVPRREHSVQASGSGSNAPVLWCPFPHPQAHSVASFVRTLTVARRWHLSYCSLFNRQLFCICPSRDCELLEVRGEVPSCTLRCSRGHPVDLVMMLLRLCRR